MPYRTLDKDRITATASRLEQRIGERFPDSSLRKVAVELVALANDTGIQAAALEKPVIWLRILTGLAVLCAAMIFALVGTVLSFDRISTGAFDFVQGLESLLNTLVFAGVGVWTLVTLEERFKRKRALDGLHALRSVIHIIDMHQLTKDPAAFNVGFIPTKSSPERKLSRAELTRYLDYCSELLSITGKLAALYAQALNDSIVVNAVNDIENLGTNLSRKIWQKIMLIGETENRLAGGRGATAIH
ncbi:hypothetical protein [Oricola thermophila]|uniref:Uncharacterized protein n=1 Tax=Oricola thermophila TaxID=2742145 RepID=A0A6N1VEN7_9HYPH|nr:hypothetical protein [Oricola thermophila]QKV19421.1 hypothetical protein HTY61_13605 [Oricola thermophila]